MTLELLKQIAKALSIQFGKDCEIVIHDLKKSHLNSSIIYIENGQVTHRKTGDGPSSVVLEALKQDPAKIHDHLGYLTKTEDGKVLRSSTVFVKKSPKGPFRYIFSINYDITNLLYFQESIHHMINEPDEITDGSCDEEPKLIRTSVSKLLDDLISQSVSLIGKPSSLMTKDEKKAAIRFLNDSGAFLITKSGDKISRYFGISKYTLYNYIKSDEEH